MRATKSRLNVGYEQEPDGIQENLLIGEDTIVLGRDIVGCVVNRNYSHNSRRTKLLGMRHSLSSS